MTLRNSVLKDPKTKYPQPPYEGHTQAKPGVIDDMFPKPDHGETSYKGSKKLHGLSALITGGDSGIGRAVAIAFAREGANVAFTYLSDSENEDARETEQLIRESGVKGISFKIDQRYAKDCEKVVQDVVREFGGLDILVNNAAFQETYSDIQHIPEDELDDMFKVNIESFYYFSRAALQFLPAGGSIINTSSIQSFKPSMELSPYAATKAAISNFTISLAKQAIDQGVRVNAVAPGPVWTPLIPSSMNEDKVKNFGKHSLFGRPAQPAELAPVYVFLASDDASFVSGEIYGVTGGEKQI